VGGNAEKTVPIIAPYGDDPIGAGLAASLAHPGGNVTGFVAYTGPEFEAKRLQLLKEAVPNATRIAFLGMKQVWDSPAGQAVQDAARMLGIKLIHVEHAPDNYAGAFAQLSRDRPDALFVAYHPVNYANRELIAQFAGRRPHVLFCQHDRSVPSRRLSNGYLECTLTESYSDRAADEVRVLDQPQDGQNPRARDSREGPRPRR
jgi:ABC-type uncharacterized transport system substrate-binding protein